MRLRGGLPVLWRGLTELQVGTDPRWSTALTDLSPAAARALAGLPGGSDVRLLRSRLTGCGVPPDEAAAVLDHLRRASLLVGATTTRPATPDDLAWSLVDGPGAGDRGRLAVRVEGLGRLGLRVTAALATAGVGVLDLVDPNRVTAGDVEAGGYGTQDVGASRVGAAARVLHDAVPGVRLTRACRPPDLVVLVEQHVADPVRYRDLLADDVPHLSVVVREASVAVGPLVVPGDGPCLRCVELHRADRDERWPAVAAQLVATRSPLLGGEEVTVAAVGAGLAAARCLAFLDGRSRVPRGAAVEIAVPDVVPRAITWSTHPDCGCTGPPASPTPPTPPSPPAAEDGPHRARSAPDRATS